MSLRFAVLGLLALKPASGYDIKRTIDRSIHFIWNVTGPQVYNTLRALRDEGLIESRRVPQAGKPDKQVHSVTPAGKDALARFVNEPIGASITRDEVLLRIFFSNFADEALAMRELDAYLGRICHERAALEAVEARVEAHPGARHEARRFQLLSLRLKVAQYKAMEAELEKFRRGRGRTRPSASPRPVQKPSLALVYPPEQSAPARARKRR